MGRGQLAPLVRGVMGSVQAGWDPWKAAWDEALRLGHSAPGSYHGLLALLRVDTGDLARRSLEESGLSADRFERWVCHRADMVAENEEDLSSGWDRVLGRAEGFAAALGLGPMQPLHLLLGLLWDPVFWPWVYCHHGVRPERVLDLLSNEVAVPGAAALPEPDAALRIRGTRRLLCPRPVLSAVLQTLNDRGFGAGTAYGFTLPEDLEAWIVADEHLPVETIILEALASPTQD